MESLSVGADIAILAENLCDCCNLHPTVSLRLPPPSIITYHGVDMIVLKSFGYTKMEADTWIRVNLDFVIRMANGITDEGCATYYIRVSTCVVTTH